MLGRGPVRRCSTAARAGVWNQGKIKTGGEGEPVPRSGATKRPSGLGALACPLSCADGGQLDKPAPIRGSLFVHGSYTTSGEQRTPSERNPLDPMTDSRQLRHRPGKFPQFFSKAGGGFGRYKACKPELMQCSQRQTRCKAGTQSHGAPWARRATCDPAPSRLGGGREQAKSFARCPCFPAWGTEKEVLDVPAVPRNAGRA
jgi:hypothetical protein